MATYLPCFLLVSLATVGSPDDSLPSKCYVEKFAMIEIICPNSNITALPSQLPRLVDTVCLQQNRIRTINLSRLGNVNKLNLSQNILTSFPWESLKHMKKITTLDVSHNRLSTVRLDLALKDLRRLKYVNLAYNKLATFSEANLGVSFRSVGPFAYRHIHGNPIRCDCRMAWLSQLARTFHHCLPFSCTAAVRNSLLFTSFVYSDVLMCDSPDSLKGVPVHSANLSSCPAVQETTTKTYLKVSPTNNTTGVIAASSVDEDWNENQIATWNHTYKPDGQFENNTGPGIATSIICIALLGVWLAFRRWLLL
ncbi:slit homolog 3 protein-like [Branchiostoma floridae]|uniref:Slit homolog 3 protein-like n=1 Tax=Branchiostoma floridae TaxID=7739 RepID=C3ZDH1_BRAFL|nr:slit homolog 3 protein-like [Branchiostoma floridae]|eukprot:XP_002592766.1 hypothetical protein BRAFLDRAFT_65346 [Branchiostoma floridae]